MCLQLITSVLIQQPQPLNTAAYAPLEATCRLVHAFGEGVNPAQYNQFISEGTFPQLLHALHETNISSHKHAQVVLSYFEVFYY